MASEVAASAIGSFPSAPFPRADLVNGGVRTVFLVLPSGPRCCDSRVTVVPQSWTSGLFWMIFLGRHDRSEFFGCLRGREWEGHRWVVSASQQPSPQGMREVLEEKDSGQVGWCLKAGAADFGEVAVDAEPDGGSVGSWETLQESCEPCPPSGDGAATAWPGPGSAPWGRSGSAVGRTGGVLTGRGKATEEGLCLEERSLEEAECCVRGSCGVREVGAGQAQSSWRQDTQPGGQTGRDVRVQGGGPEALSP